MDVTRRWFCTCSGKKIELRLVADVDDGEAGEPACERCGATPSSDPKKTVTYQDERDWEN